MYEGTHGRGILVHDAPGPVHIIGELLHLEVHGKICPLLLSVLRPLQGLDLGYGHLEGYLLGSRVGVFLEYGESVLIVRLGDQGQIGLQGLILGNIRHIIVGGIRILRLLSFLLRNKELRQTFKSVESHGTSDGADELLVSLLENIVDTGSCGKAHDTRDHLNGDTALGSEPETSGDLILRLLPQKPVGIVKTVACPELHRKDDAQHLLGSRKSNIQKSHLLGIILQKTAFIVGKRFQGGRHLKFLTVKIREDDTVLGVEPDDAGIRIGHLIIETRHDNALKLQALAAVDTHTTDLALRIRLGGYGTRLSHGDLHLF